MCIPRWQVAVDTTAQLLAAQKKVENHENELRESVLATQRLQATNDELTTKLQCSEEALQDARAKALQHACAEEQVQMKYSETVAAAQALQDANAALQSQVEELQTQVEVKQQKLTAVSQTLEAETADAAAQLVAARQKVESHESELRESVLATEKLQATNDELTTKLQCSEEALQDARAKALQHACAEEQVQMKYSETVAAAQALQDANAALQSQVEELQTQVEVKQQKLTAVSQTLEAETADAAAQLVAARKKVENHESELLESVLATEKLQATNDELTTKLQCSEQALQDLESQKQAAAAELEICSTAVARAEADKMELQAKFAELRGQLFAAVQAQEASKELIEALRGEVASASVLPEVEKLQESLCSTQSELADAVTAKERLQADVDRLKFAEINANMTKSAKDRAEAQVKELKLDLDHWRQKALSFQRDEDRAKRQSQDISSLEVEVKDLHQQNAQLLLTFQQFKTELDTALAENHCLQETIDMYEMNLQRATDQKAELMGHSNPKQKIRHMVNLKEENKELREQLKKAKQRITQLGVSRKGEGLLEALASFSHSHSVGDQLSVSASPWGPETPNARGSETRTPKRPGTPTRKPASARGARSNPHEEEYLAARMEEERRRQMQERTVERMQTDFQHFIALIERAVLSEDRVEDAPNPAALLERLRAVASKRVEIATRSSRPDADAPLELEIASECDLGLQVGECGDTA
ncbi:GIP [Symbiodinium sp. CCMP2592]|nr:GIP [Symbiodinium sp. CCMP2592]